MQFEFFTSVQEAFTSLRQRFNTTMRRGYFLAVSLFFILCVMVVQLYFQSIGTGKIYDSDAINSIPRNSVGLVLGTSSLTSDGRKNVFFESRMQAAKELYDAKKIDCILLSGDNSTPGYNEPIQMQSALLSRGIPSERMYLDFAGLRTRDSILRAREIFGLENFTIISQEFHIKRAMYHANSEGLFVVGYAAKNIPFSLAPRVYVREFFSRFIAVYDRFVGTDAKFLGDTIHIEYNSEVRPIPSKICTPR